MISLVEINLCEESGTGSLGGATLFALHSGEHGVGILEVVDDLLPAFVVGIFGVRKSVVVGFLHVGLVHERNLLEETLQLEVTIGAEELHLSSTLLDDGALLISTCKDVERKADTRKIVVELVPDGAEWPVGGHHTGALLKAVERFAIGEIRTAYIGVVRTGVVVPEREGSIHILDGNEACISRNEHIVDILRILYLVLSQRGLWHLFLQEVGTARHTKDYADYANKFICRFHNRDIVFLE